MDEQETQTVIGGFFPMDLSQVDAMVKADAAAEDVMAYMVLARGVNRRDDLRISTHGANSIALRTGMTYTKAEKALAWLVESGFIEKAPGQNLGKGSSRSHQARWIILDGVDVHDIYLANSLVEGVGRGKQSPPLQRIYTETTPQAGRLTTDARLDALMVMLHLYRHQDMADCGGIDPRSGVFRKWVSVENSHGEAVTPLYGTNSSIYEVEGDCNVFFTKFAEESLFYIADPEERSTRFWEAFNSLHRTGFLYEVTQVWSADPNDKVKGRKAEPLYTLYIHDSKARQSEPYLQKSINAAALRVGALDNYTEFSGYQHWVDDGSMPSFGNILGTGRFRYVATSGSAYPIGIYRLRHRPHTRDSGIGIKQERQRVQQWAQALSASAR